MNCSVGAERCKESQMLTADTRSVWSEHLHDLLHEIHVYVKALEEDAESQ